MSVLAYINLYLLTALAIAGAMSIAIVIIDKKIARESRERQKRIISRKNGRTNAQVDRLIYRLRRDRGETEDEENPD